MAEYSFLPGFSQGSPTHHPQVAAIAVDFDILCLLIWQAIFRFSAQGPFILLLTISSLIRHLQGGVGVQGGSFMLCKMGQGLVRAPQLFD